MSHIAEEQFIQQILIVENRIKQAESVDRLGNLRTLEQFKKSDSELKHIQATSAFRIRNDNYQYS